MVVDPGEIFGDLSLDEGSGRLRPVVVVERVAGDDGTQGVEVEPARPGIHVPDPVLPVGLQAASAFLEPLLDELDGRAVVGRVDREVPWDASEPMIHSADGHRVLPGLVELDEALVVVLVDDVTVQEEVAVGPLKRRDEVERRVPLVIVVGDGVVIVGALGADARVVVIGLHAPRRERQGQEEQNGQQEAGHGLPRCAPLRCRARCGLVEGTRLPPFDTKITSLSTVCLPFP